MGDKTGIAWCDSTWNPIRGCQRVSLGCGGPGRIGGCYAEKVAYRFSGPGQPYQGLVKMTSNGPRWTGKIAFVKSMLDQPLRWKKPRRIFVNSMSDLFHENVKDEWLLEIFTVMASAHWHTFQVLTKRPERMRAVMERIAFITGMNIAKFPGGKHHILLHTAVWKDELEAAIERGSVKVTKTDPAIKPFRNGGSVPPNVHLGVSVEDQETADERIPILLQTPAAVRWTSYEPALGPVDFYPWTLGDSLRRLAWVVVGGESGAGARPFDLAWASSTIDQCRAAGSRCFVKQLGAKPYQRQPGSDWAGDLGRQFIRLVDRAGADPAEWPAFLRVQEFP